MSWTGRLAALALGDGDVRGTTCGGECDGERLGERDGERLGEREGERLGEGEGDASSSSLGESQSVEGTRRSSTATRRGIFFAGAISPRKRERTQPTLRVAFRRLQRRELIPLL